MAKTKFFDELTGIRAIAVYLVFLHHFNIFNERRFGSFIHNFVGEFHIGVTIFFVLSGFLICYRYYDNIKLRDKKWIVQYLQNRVARIFPMYYFVTTIAFLFFIVNSQNISHQIVLYISNITFIRGFFDSLKFTGVLQGWTLTVEECFYFSAPLIFMLSRKMKLIIPFLFIFSIGILGVLIFRNIDFYGFFGSFKFVFLYTFFGRCFEFFVGIKLALLYRKSYEQQTQNKVFYTIIGILWMFICVVALVLVKGDERYGVFTPSGILINNVVLPIGVAILFFGLITEKSIFKSVLSSKIFVLLGKSSFTFYLIHLGVFSTIIFKYIPNYLVVFVFINILSIIFFKTIEEPSNKFIRGLDVYSFLAEFKRKLGIKPIK